MREMGTRLSGGLVTPTVHMGPQVKGFHHVTRTQLQGLLRGSLVALEM